jgi:serine/threonine protein kinase/formylglycine-generating enzyme required for sulfatase activity
VLLDKLGEGGMGEVWLANDRELSQAGEPAFVALKFLSSSIKNDPRALAALRTEVRRSQRLTHPNIVRIFDLHTTPSGAPFVKMEFVEGNSLKRWLEERPTHVMPWRMAAKIGQQLASALQYAHEAEGIVHRDLKPGNLLLSEGPVIKLADFGIASAIQDRSTSGKEEMGLGTIWYASPQQLDGQPARPEDDVYAFGVTLYELLTGSLPLEADSVEEFMGKVRYEPPQSILERLRSLGRRNEVPSRLLALVECCLEKDPLLRPKTRELSRQLSALQGDHAPVAAAATSVSVQNQWVEEPEPAKSSHWGARLLVLLLAGLATAAWLQDWKGLRTAVQESIHAGGKPTAEANRSLDNHLVKPLPEVKPGESEEQPELLPAPPGTGTLSVHLVNSYGAKTPIQCEILGQTALKPISLQGLGQTLFPLLPGAYTVVLTDSAKPPWKLERKVTVESKQSAIVRLSFEYAGLEVTSDPPVAEVTWPPEANVPTQIETKTNTPFTKRFKSGEIPFTAHLRYYADTTAVHSFYPTADPASRKFQIVLGRTKGPMTSQSWTNSLDMVFLPVGPHLWASRTETTVREFREFVLDARYDAAQGMFSVTSNGWKQIGYSWEKPGFAQADNYPVIGVNWADAAKFCKWLEQHERAQGRLSKDQGYRLPKTNEWFQLAGNERFPWGADAGQVVGNYSGREVTNADWPKPWPILSDHLDDFPRTAPVDADKFGANRLGFRHLGGNAAEWCHEKVLCGGSWFDGESGNLKALQTTSIDIPRDPGERHDRNGFRVVISEPE